MNSLNYKPVLEKSKSNSAERIVIAVVAIMVSAAVIFGLGRSLENMAAKSQAQSAALSANESAGSTVEYFKESTMAEPAHLVDPYWQHFHDYMAPAAAEASLYANPELKVLAYPQADKAAVQVVTGWESRLLVFPEALDGMAASSIVSDLYANPELKVLDYPVATAAAVSLYENPELKVLDYPDASASATSLYDNPELKVLNYPIIDRAATQVIGGAEARVLVFPEATDRGLSATSEASLYVNPELKVLDYPAASATAASLYDNPELKALSYPDIRVNGADIHDNPELHYLNYATPTEAKRSAVDILRPYSNNR